MTFKINCNFMIKCPLCGEEIKELAKKCKRCGEWLDKESKLQYKINNQISFFTKRNLIYIGIIFSSIISYSIFAFIQNNISTTYPGCNKPDIVINSKDGRQVWSACNIGTNIAGIGKGSYGNYYQWGRNDVGYTDTWNDDNWGLRGQGPCADGYHIPTKNEWQSVFNYFKSDLSNKLLLPPAGLYDGFLRMQGEVGNYWSSSSIISKSNVAYVLNFYDIYYNVKHYSKIYGFSIRCLKN